MASARPGPTPTIVVQAHPLEDSYNAALRDRIVAGLAAAGHPTTTFRLGLDERPTDDELVAANRLVLVYPTWSGGLPAVVLDWVHQVLDSAATRPVLAGVDHLVVVTTCGSSRLVNRVQGEWGRRYLATELLARCAWRARFTWFPLYKVDRLSGSELSAHLDRAEAAFATGRFAAGRFATGPVTTA